ncbi:putative methyltransferase [Astathelohania contejeani]|uniref:Methyltransferase n=1 Tax=Astathelohania contejeani TaxID=164912 RepID=A0ABQ7I149_9MICR|nr:putative methyltransferase [Thelohania contejeani]
MSDELELKTVHDFYSSCADKFNTTRRKPWPQTQLFISKYSTPTSLLLDSGCGNGRASTCHPNTIGIDYSLNLLKYAYSRCTSPFTQFQRGNVINLPYKDGMFDLILSIAVVHHLTTEERRNKCFQEMHRVLAPNGKALVYVWSSEYKNKSKFRSAGLKSDQDVFASWNGSFEKVRFYHLYTLGELEEQARRNGFTILKSGSENESLYVIIEKINNFNK